MLSNFLLYAGALPLAVSAAIAFVLRQLHCPARLTWPAAIACGFIVGRLAVRSQSGFGDAVLSIFTPHETIDWLPLVVLLTVGVTFVMHLSGPQRQRRKLALAAALSLAVPVRLLSGHVRVTHWSVPEKVAYLLLLAGILGFVWFLLATNADENDITIRVPLLILIAVGTAIALTQSGALISGLAAATVAASIAGPAVVFLATWRRSGATDSVSASRVSAFSGISGAAAVITFSLGSLILLGNFYAELSELSAALLFLSLAAASAPLPATLRHGPTWRQLFIRCTACLLPLGIALLGTSL